MIIYLTTKSGKKIGVNFSLVTFIEDCNGLSNVHFPNASIWVQESLDEINTTVRIQKIAEEIKQ